MTTPPDSEQQSVRLSVPASARFLASARLVAASLGADSGLSVDDLEDLRLGVNELLSVLVDGAAPGARVDLDFVALEGTITVTGVIDGPSGEPVVADTLTRRILEAVADHHELDGTSFVLTKASSLREQV